ncbi:hypothetical protein [Parapedobacter sp. 10938]|uniref:hypothetical protein n=1 Tax=Parapedobacter flavus TaxID=3110225 RepID=UPI002DB60B49|nr:hypothetical protein [Parapedobacter sp. 10938]MEC3880059.1 hypothetical protein [Parapedobacter sp. 10938]
MTDDTKMVYRIAWLFIGLLCAQCVGSREQLPRAEVKDREGVPTLFVNGTPYPPYAYMSYLGESQFYEEMEEAGLHLYNIPAYLGDRGINSVSGIKPFRSPIWVGHDELDYTSIIADFEELIAADPQALAIIRIHLDAPEWWESSHPEHASLQPDGSTFRTSLYSALWRDDASKVLVQLVQWLEQSPYAKHLVGIHVAGGFTEEWMYHFKDEFYDESSVRLERFREWLRTRYMDNVARLRQSWNRDDVTFDSAQLGDISGKTKARQWRHPDTAGQVFDTFVFHGENMADHIAHFCRIVKEASNGRLLTGAFYGYHYFVGDLRRGHGALAKLLRCPDLDYLSSPNDYHRVIGEDWAPFAAIKSVQLHGKLWLAENDTRTSITTLLRDRAPHVQPEGNAYTDGVWLGPDSMEESEALLWKNLGRMLAYGYGGWWFDMWGGWFSDPKLIDILAAGQRFFERYPDEAFPAMAPRVAVVVDEKLGAMDASFGALTGGLLHNRYALGKTGVPYDLYLREDLDAVKDGGYQVVWYLGLLSLTEEERSFLDEAASRDIWMIWTDGYESTVYQSDDGVDHMDAKIQWSASELGDLFGKAGVHRYLEGGKDVLYAGRGWICLHSVAGGDKLINLPFSATIIDPIADAVITDGDSFKVAMDANSTRLFKLVQKDLK